MPAMPRGLRLVVQIAILVSLVRWGSASRFRDFRLMSKNVSSTLDTLLAKERYDKRLRPELGGKATAYTLYTMSYVAFEETSDVGARRHRGPGRVGNPDASTQLCRACCLPRPHLGLGGSKWRPGADTERGHRQPVGIRHGGDANSCKLIEKSAKASRSVFAVSAADLCGFLLMSVFRLRNKGRLSLINCVLLVGVVGPPPGRAPAARSWHRYRAQPRSPHGYHRHNRVSSGPTGRALGGLRCAQHRPLWPWVRA